LICGIIYKEVMELITTIRDASKKYGIEYRHLWKIMKQHNVEPVKEVRRGKRRYLFYDEGEIERVLRESGYLDEANNELLRKFYGKRAHEEPSRG